MSTFKAKRLEIELFEASGCLTNKTLLRLAFSSCNEKELTLIEKHLHECKFCNDALKGMNENPSLYDDFDKRTQVLHQFIDEKLDVSVKQKTITQKNYSSLIKLSRKKILIYAGMLVAILLVMVQIKREGNILHKGVFSFPAMNSKSTIVSNQNEGFKRLSPKFISIANPIIEQVSVENASAIGENDSMDISSVIVNEVSLDEFSALNRDIEAKTGLVAETSVAPISKPDEQKQPVFKNKDYLFFSDYLVKSIQYPIGAVQKGLAGKVLVSFVISKSGVVEDVKVMNSIHPLLDAEAIRVVKNSPSWIPAYSNRKPISYEMSVPVEFILKQ